MSSSDMRLQGGKRAILAFDPEREDMVLVELPCRRKLAFFVRVPGRLTGRGAWSTPLPAAAQKQFSGIVVVRVTYFRVRRFDSGKKKCCIMMYGRSIRSRPPDVGECQVFSWFVSLCRMLAGCWLRSPLGCACEIGCKCRKASFISGPAAYSCKALCRRHSSSGRP